MISDFLAGFEAATVLFMKRLDEEDIDSTRRYLEAVLETIAAKKEEV